MLGLINVMEKLSDPNKLGAGIAVAFVATVYGVGSANLLFLPIASKLRSKAGQRAKHRELILEGILAIQEGLNPRLIDQKLRGLLGCEGSVVVNNCAAAVLLAVNTLAEGREVLVSRGELVEIGGSFRIPEILGKGGARLVEVGTTNKTWIGDYREAISERTALVLKVHRSNLNKNPSIIL